MKVGKYRVEWYVDDEDVGEIKYFESFEEVVDYIKELYWSDGGRIVIK